MVEQVWQPRQGVPSEPVETLIRAARNVLPLAQGPDTLTGSIRRKFILDLAEWGNPAEVSLRCALQGVGEFGARKVLSYAMAGEVAAVGALRRFTGTAKVDVATGAFLDIEITPSAPTVIGPNGGAAPR